MRGRICSSLPNKYDTAMTAERTYDFLVDYLVEKLTAASMEGFGIEDKKIDRYTEAMMCDVFERYIYSEVMSYFYINKGDRLTLYNGMYYESASPDVMKQIVKRTMSRLDMGLVYQKNSYDKIAQECIDAMRVLGKARFEPNRRYIVFNNCVMDLEDDRLVDFDESYKTDLHLDFDYKKDARSDIWDEKLMEIIPDEEMREALQMFFGCLLINRRKIKIEYVCFLLGPGGNGKSVIVDAVVNTFGKDLFSRFTPEHLFKSSQSMYHLAALDGKIANFCDDVSNKDFSGGDFKSFVSGAEFEARHPYGRNTFKVTAPLLICCANKMPPSMDDTQGFHRRILPIYSTNVTRSGKEKDTSLTFKLESTEIKQAVFNWVLDGRRKIIECGGDIPIGESVMAAKQELMEDSNSARRWIRDSGLVRIEPKHSSDSRWKPLTEWYKEYVQYCSDYGDRNPQSAKSLSSVFKDMKFVSERRTSGMFYCIGRYGIDVERTEDGEIEEIETDNLPF